MELNSLSTVVQLNRLTQLIAVVAGERFEYLTAALRSDPAGAGLGGTMSTRRPYGFKCQLRVRMNQSAHSEQAVQHLLRHIRPLKFHP